MGRKRTRAVRTAALASQNWLGDFLRELRARLGFSQGQLAAELGVSYPTVSRWETGRSKPKGLAKTTLRQYIIRIGADHPDLLARFLGQPSSTVETPSQRTDKDTVLVFNFQVMTELQHYVRHTAEGMAALVQKAQSGDAEAREVLRLGSVLANVPGRPGMLEALRAAVKDLDDSVVTAEGKKRERKPPVAR